MILVQQSASLISITDPLARIEHCGRICYNSFHNAGTGTARPFVERLIRSNHTSVLEHARIVIPEGEDWRLPVLCNRNDSTGRRVQLPYGYHDRTFRNSKGGLNISARDFIALGGDLDYLQTAELADDYITVDIICSRSAANQLERHRVFSFSQESMRYISYRDSIQFIDMREYLQSTENDGIWMAAMQDAERAYHALVSNGVEPQYARGVLPLDTKTRFAMSGLKSDWRKLIEARTEAGVQPSTVALMKMVQAILEESA